MTALTKPVTACPIIRVPRLVIADLTIAGVRVRVRGTNFARGETFETKKFGPDGLIPTGDICPLLIRPSQSAVDQALQRLERFREEWIAEFIRVHRNGPEQTGGQSTVEFCYWYNWLCQVEERPCGALQGGGYMYKITERGCPAVYDPVIDAEWERGGIHDQTMNAASRTELQAASEPLNK